MQMSLDFSLNILLVTGISDIFVGMQNHTRTEAGAFCGPEFINFCFVKDCMKISLIVQHQTAVIFYFGCMFDWMLSGSKLIHVVMCVAVTRQWLLRTVFDKPRLIHLHHKMGRFAAALL